MMAIDTIASTPPAPRQLAMPTSVGAGICGQRAAQDGGAGQGEADGGDQPTAKRFADLDWRFDLPALRLGSKSCCGTSSTAVPISLLLLAAVALALAVVVLAVWLIRRTVPVTREWFLAEISAWVAFAGAAVMAALVTAGLVHLRHIRA